ncbi:MAG: WbqC family protein [Candidatus Kapabacteria bacterium]|nr:WbqC family protein [Candidatus Kapabacteria bacterium]
MKKVAIVQSNYIPWKGYFDMINMVDEFILYDDVQYTRRDWRNRNIIKTPNGLHWLTIPVSVKGKFFQKINETKISDPNWAKIHWNTIKFAYSKAKFFNDYKEYFERFYLSTNEILLSKINQHLLKICCDILDIKTIISTSDNYKIIDGKNEKLISLCQQANANIYISGPAAKDYLDEALFAKEGIQVIWMDYSGYPEYNQLYPPFVHEVSIIDLIFNEGPNATKFMKSFGK